MRPKPLTLDLASRQRRKLGRLFPDHDSSECRAVEPQVELQHLMHYSAARIQRLVDDQGLGFGKACGLE